MATRCRNTFSLAGHICTPSMLTLPWVGFVRPLTARKSVDLPAPDGPSTTQNWPRGISIDTFLKACVPSGHALETDLKWIMSGLLMWGRSACAGFFQNVGLDLIGDQIKHLCRISHFLFADLGGVAVHLAAAVTADLVF